MAFVFALCLLAFARAEANAAAPISGTREHPCEVGGPPAWYFWRIAPGVRRLSPIVTIACGRRLLDQPYEIVAVDTSRGLWVYADSGPLGFSAGQSVLPGALSPAITVESGWSKPPARSQLYGVLGENVARVEVVFHHRRKRKRVVAEPTTALVNGELLSELHQTQPFGAYALTIPGCVPPKGVRVIAFNAQGQRVGSARASSFAAHPCNPKTWFRAGSAPRRIAKPRTLIACLSHGRFEYFSRPTRCDLFSRSGLKGEARFHDLQTSGLHWKTWGGPKAEASGTDSTGLRLSVIPYSRIRCHGAVYYRLAEVRRLRSGRTYRLRLARCGQPRFRS